MGGDLKPVEWIGNSLDTVRSFEKAVRQQVGFELELVQHGLDPTDWQPMSSIAPGIREIRLHVVGEHRVLFVAKFKGQFMFSPRSQRQAERLRKQSLNWCEPRYQEVLKQENRTK